MSKPDSKPDRAFVKTDVPAELWARVRARGFERGQRVPQIVEEALTLWLGEGRPPAADDLGSPPVPSRKAGDR